MNDETNGQSNSTSSSSSGDAPVQPEMPPQAATQQYNQPPPRRSYVVPIGIGVGVGCLVLAVVFFALMVGFITAAGLSGGEVRGGNVALIRVTGTITGGKSDMGLLSGSAAGAEDLVNQLERARKDSNIKAIVIRINSPGGSAAGSEEVWREIMRVRKSGKPVYASMADVAASGGYYIASACDRIYADASTITGSIGVIFSGADLSELYDKIGLRPEVVKSGKFKDIGSPARPLTPEERALLQNMVNSIYYTFVRSVAEGRKMALSEVKKLADGRIFTGEQAVKLRLVDEIGGLRETTLAAARAGGIKKEPQVVEYGRKGFWSSILSGDNESLSQMERAIAREVLNSLLGKDSTHAGFK